MKTIVLLAVFLTFLGCSGVDPEIEKAQIKGEMQNLTREIDALTVDKQCTQLSDCGLLPTGVAPCGGPTGFVVYSKLKTDAESLRRRTDRYSVLQKQLNTLDQVVGSCVMLTTPTVQCAASVCQKQN